MINGAVDKYPFSKYVIDILLSSTWRKSSVLFHM